MSSSSKQTMNTKKTLTEIDKYGKSIQGFNGNLFNSVLSIASNVKLQTFIKVRKKMHPIFIHVVRQIWSFIF